MNTTGQTRLGSLIESAANIAIGYSVAVASQILIFPFFNIEVSVGQNLEIAAWFTVVSVVRSYAIRRWFNRRLQRAAENMAKRWAP